MVDLEGVCGYITPLFPPPIFLNERMVTQCMESMGRVNKQEKIKLAQEWIEDLEQEELERREAQGEIRIYQSKSKEKLKLILAIISIIGYII